MKNIVKGAIFYADLDPIIGSEQKGVRPVLIIQNDIGNKFSPTVLVAPISSSAHSLLTFPSECLNCAKIPSSAAGSSSPQNAPIAPMIFRCSTSSVAIHFVLFVQGMNPRRRPKSSPIVPATPIPMVQAGSCASFPINFRR